MNSPLSSSLENMYWIGGTSGSAKSTIARRIAAEHDMLLYSTDEVMGNHANRCTREECPLLEEFKQMTMDERWATRTPEAMFETFQWFHGEGFNLIIEDLLELPSDRKVIVEGFRLLPNLVKPLLKKTCQAVWLISTPEFRFKAFNERGTLRDIPDKTSNPEKALQNHLERESLFMQHLIEETRTEGVTALTVDGSFSEEELLKRVSTHFEIGQPNKA
ncbi:MAG: hypothetical protein AB3N64_08565 [Puniceicoccaceae bacterium]